jgi:hypothetical protein
VRSFAVDWRNAGSCIFFELRLHPFGRIPDNKHLLVSLQCHIHRIDPASHYDR